MQPGMDYRTFHDLAVMRLNCRDGLPPHRLGWIQNSLSFKFYKFFTNEVEGVCGFMIWAYVNDETIVRLSRFNKFPVYGYEWDEGSIALILDVVHSSDGRRLTLSSLEESFPRDIDRVAFVKRDSLKLHRRIDGRLRRVELEQFVVRA